MKVHIEVQNIWVGIASVNPVEDLISIPDGFRPHFFWSLGIRTCCRTLSARKYDLSVYVQSWTWNRTIRNHPEPSRTIQNDPDFLSRLSHTWNSGCCTSLREFHPIMIFASLKVFIFVEISHCLFDESHWSSHQGHRALPISPWSTGIGEGHSKLPGEPLNLPRV